MATLTVGNLATLSPSELETGDRILAWREDHSTPRLTDVPLDDSHDREWTVWQLAYSAEPWTFRVYFMDNTWMEFDPGATMVVERPEMPGVDEFDPNDIW